MISIFFFRGMQFPLVLNSGWVDFGSGFQGAKYTCDADGNKRDLSRQPFANAALREMGGDAAARPLMVDDPADAKRFHLIDAPRRVVTKYLPNNGFSQDPAGEDGGERVRDIVPTAGTLVLFDSVSLPHEVTGQRLEPRSSVVRTEGPAFESVRGQVLATNRERYGLQGWFHEKLFY